MNKTKYISKLSKVSQVVDMSNKIRSSLLAVEKKYAFLSNEYYLSLIDWDDPDDPIRRIAIPSEAELRPWGKLDASSEHDYVAAPGLEHKYTDTALLLVNNVCGTFCRFCFRKRLFMSENEEVSRDVSAGLEYISRHPEINNVLLTGGDPLLLSTKRLGEILRKLDTLEHIEVIRIGSKMLAFNPRRVLGDPALVALLGEHSRPDRRLYLMAHFNHPRELTGEAREAIRLIREAGVVIMNQTPMIRGVNDSAKVLRELFSALASIGVAPYYVFQCRPTQGNFAYTVPIEEGYKHFAKAMAGCSGLARRARFVMSHATGKVEVSGLSDDYIFMRYHRAAKPKDEGKFLMAERNPHAYWLDDYTVETPEQFIEVEKAAAAICS
ncbi:MAG: KamA family radical SAM protein [Deltaproteobacteria bacterium]|nr:MAG: KamA family radical SAM protein [Deltaproteobacteria bacterium]